MSCADRPAPLELILNRDVDAFDDTAANVLTVSAGTPSQRLRLTPSTMNPNIGLHDVSACSAADTTCPDKLGEVFNGDTSATRMLTSFDNWNGTRLDGADASSTKYFNDVFSPQPNKMIHGMPMMTLLSDFVGPGIFPISAGSTFMAHAVKAGLATSRSWGLYMGTKTTPGSLILGGYSNGFMAESLQQRDSADSCPICFRVNRMTLQQPSGDTRVFAPGGGNVFQAALEPYVNYISLPGNVFDKFVSTTNGTVGPNDFVVYENGIVPEGNISFQLGNQLTTTIPHDLIFTSTPPIFEGKRFSLDGNAKMARVRRSGSNTGILGLPYMSMVYLIYDDERGSLNITNAREGGASDGQLVPICPVSTTSSSRNNNSAIIGGAVGAAVALTLLLLVILFLYRRRKRSRTVQEAEHFHYSSPKKSMDSLQSSTPSTATTRREIDTRSTSAEMPVFTPETNHTKTLQSPPRVHSRLGERSLHEMPVDTSTRIDVSQYRHNSPRASLHSQEDQQQQEQAPAEWTMLSGSTLSWGSTHPSSENAQTLLVSSHSLRSGPFSNLIREGKAAEQWNRL